MNSRWLALAFICLCLNATFVCGADKSTGKHALLVGVTKYFSIDNRRHLAGPANDVRLIRDLLADRYGFPKEQVVTLSEESKPDRRPTRANIEREFQNLAKVVAEGDEVVILLAGHGSQQPDDDPENADDPEPDGLDEIFLPSDIGAWDGNTEKVANAICDDELRVWLAEIRRKGAFVWLIVDACHSGTIARGASSDVSRQMPLRSLGIPVRRASRQLVPKLKLLPNGALTLGMTSESSTRQPRMAGWSRFMPPNQSNRLQKRCFQSMEIIRIGMGYSALSSIRSFHARPHRSPTESFSREFGWSTWPRTDIPPRHCLKGRTLTKLCLARKCSRSVHGSCYPMMMIPKS